MEAASIDVTATVLALIALAGTFLSLWFGYKQQVARLTLDNELVKLQVRVTDAEAELAETKKELKTTQDDLINTKAELAATKKELVDTKQELADKDSKMGSLESRVRDLERHNGNLELEKNAKADQIRELLEENAALKAGIIKRPAQPHKGNRREL